MRNHHKNNPYEARHFLFFMDIKGLHTVGLFISYKNEVKDFILSGCCPAVSEPRDDDLAVL